MLEDDTDMRSGAGTTAAGGEARSILKGESLTTPPSPPPSPEPGEGEGEEGTRGGGGDLDLVLRSL